MTWLQLRDRIKIFRQKLSRSAGVQRCITFILACYIRLVWHSSRRIMEVDEGTQPIAHGETNAIFAFWHGRLMMIPPLKPKNRPMHVFISQHNDGELIAQTMERFSIDTVRGSSSSGGEKAGREAIRFFRSGSNISITPDGPRGPNRQAQLGIIQLARICNAPIVPISISTSRHKALRSWDRMQIPLPFCKLAACIGAPFYVSRDQDMERLRAELEDTLNALTTRADELVGLSAARSQKSATQRKVVPR